MRIVSLLVLVFALPGLALAQPPAPTPPAPVLTIDQLVTQIADLRAKRDDLEKQEKAAAADLRGRLKDLSDKLDKLGLQPPAPPAVPPVVPPVIPPAPAPVADPLKARIVAAFGLAAGTPTQKSAWAKDLAALYRALVKSAGDTKLATAGQLKGKMRDAAGVLLDGDDALREVRQAVAIELAAVLPTNDTDALTSDQRTATGALFAKLAGILDGM